MLLIVVCIDNERIDIKLRVDGRLLLANIYYVKQPLKTVLVFAINLKSYSIFIF